MKYKVGDRVKIKSLDWYNKNKDKYGCVCCGGMVFCSNMKQWCGKVMTILSVHNDFYRMGEMELNVINYWTDEMIEGLVEESLDNDMKEHQRICDEIMDIQGIKPIEAEMEEVWYCPDGYIFKDENGNVINATKIVLEKKKKEYPKTYEECCEIIHSDSNFYVDTHLYSETLGSLYKLLICRDAYWKIAGDEMGLGKPWDPTDSKVCYSIFTIAGEIQYHTTAKWRILAFPTTEMREAFYENFKELIEICKELL